MRSEKFVEPFLLEFMRACDWGVLIYFYFHFYNLSLSIYLYLYLYLSIYLSLNAFVHINTHTHTQLCIHLLADLLQDSLLSSQILIFIKPSSVSVIVLNPRSKQQQKMAATTSQYLFLVGCLLACLLIMLANIEWIGHQHNRHWRRWHHY